MEMATARGRTRATACPSTRTERTARASTTSSATTKPPGPTPRPRPSIAAARHLLTQDGFRKLFAARIISQLGDGIFQLAAADLLLFKHPGSNPAWTLTKLSAVTLIPF